MTKLTPKQQRFVEQYVRDLNATQDAIRAGYSEKTANKSGPRLLVNVGVKAAIEAKMKVLSEKADISTQWVLEKLRAQADVNLLDYVTIGDNGLPVVDLKNMTREQASALRGIKATQVSAGDDVVCTAVDLKLADPVVPLTQIGKHLGMFASKHEHSGPDGGPIEVADANILDTARRIAFVLAQAQQQGEG